jgi:hypothetical protein
MRKISLVAAIALLLAGKISLIAAIALMLAGATSTTQARIDVPAGAQIDPLQIAMSARHLPVAHYDDYSLVFPSL